MIRSSRRFNPVLVALVAAGLPLWGVGGRAVAATEIAADGATAIAAATEVEPIAQAAPVAIAAAEPDTAAVALEMTPATTAPGAADALTAVDAIAPDGPDAAELTDAAEATEAAELTELTDAAEVTNVTDLNGLGDLGGLDGAARRDRWIAQAATGGTCVNDLGTALNAIARSQGGRWGMRIETLDGDRIFHQAGAEQSLIPASNAKLFVTAAALQLYSPETKVQNSSLSSWITTINQRSQNDLADRLFRQIGGQPAIQRALAPLGVEASGYRLADGSGLSRSNAVQPNTTISLLRAMSRDRHSALFRDSLPASGVSGTLVNRFRGTPAQGRVFAKTGTLRGVRALSGYMAHPLYGSLVFSIIANHPSQRGDGLRSAIDRMVLTTMQMRPCDTGPMDPLNLRPGFPPRLPSVFEEFRQRQEQRRRQQQGAQPL
jgi:D-alanyl-D-alanine carboxypeptidase/D-alanyl-D-alanine-endopeptidase (penicillin-binding protein 4)